MREDPTEPTTRPKTLDEYTTQQAKDADPHVLARAIRDDPEIRHDSRVAADEAMTTLAPLLAKIWQRREKLDPQVHTRIRSELMSIAWEIELLMELGEHDEETRAQILIGFLMLPPDDDDEAEPAPEPLPRGDLVPA